jgi:ribonuclease E
VAIYTLNQKRRELARIEADYGMTVSFAPDDTVLAGNFEIERTQQRHPDDKPRIAVQVDAAPPQIAEDENDADILEEEEEEEEVLETEDGAEGVSAETVVEQTQRQDGQDRDGRRRRRRRGGRNRNRERGERDGQREQRPHGENGGASHQAAQDGAEHSPIEGLEGAPESGDVAINDEPRAEGFNGQPQGDSEHGEGGPRRRRRRRGRRGRGGQGNGSQQDYQGEGVPVDASVRDNGDEIDNGAGDDGIAPNTASSPVWSLTPEPVAEPAYAPEPAPQADGAPIGEAVPAQTTEPLPIEPTAPARKGWWQRTFKREE